MEKVGVLVNLLINIVMGIVLGVTGQLLHVCPGRPRCI